MRRCHQRISHGIVAVALAAGLAGTTAVVMTLDGSASAATIGVLRATLADPGATSVDAFGGAVAKSGTGVGSTVVVGAHNGNSGAGAAYIYVKGSSGWPTAPTVTLADPAATNGDEFGFSVAVSGNTVVVGTPVNNLSAGEAYIYVKGSSGWPTAPTATLTGPAVGDGFGSSVAVSGHTVVVGGDGTNSNSGAVFIYVKGSSGWPTAPTATLTDPVAGIGAFGFSVAVSGNTVGVGASNTNSNAGAAYIYVKGSSGWPTAPTAALADPAATGNDYFGSSVGISENRAVVGAFGTTSNAGAAYIYVKGSSGWPTAPTAALADPAATGKDYFGFSVAVSGGSAVVGADGTNTGAGAAYIYSKSSSGWPSTPTATLTDPPAAAGDVFGHSVAVSGGSAVVGAVGTSTGAGAAYIYWSTS